MQKVILKLVMQAMGTPSLSKPEEALKLLRKQCVKKNAAIYNDWIVEVKKTLCERGKKNFWEKIVKGKLKCTLYYSTALRFL